MPTDLCGVHVRSAGRTHLEARWIKREFPSLYYITREYGVRGWYCGGDPALCDSAWVQANVRPCGALGALYLDYNGGDVFSGHMGPVRGMKEGNTPAWINLATGTRDRLAGWGGTLHEVAPRRFGDAQPQWPINEGDPDPRMVNVHHHRPAYQADFARRLAPLR